MLAAELGRTLAHCLLLNIPDRGIKTMTQVSVQPAIMSVESEIESFTYSAYLLALDEDDDDDTNSDPILSLDSGSRTAFLLHHVLGYEIEEAALLLEMTETEFRVHLRSAYLQLASAQFAPEVHLDEPAFA